MIKAIFVSNTGFSLYNFRLSLMKHLSANGWHITGIANDEDDFESRFEKEKISFINLSIDHKGKNLFKDIVFLLKLVKLYKKQSPQLVHHFTIKPVIFGSLAARIAGVPSINNTITGLGYTFENDGVLNKIAIFLYKIALKNNVQVVFQNMDDFKCFVAKNLIQAKQGHVVFGSGVDTEAISPTANQVIENKSYPLRFVLISRMLWSKGIREFVQAAEAVKLQFPASQFIMAGGFSGGGAAGNPKAIPESWLNQVNQRGIVNWVNRIPHEEVMKLLDEASVVVLPSYREGIPKALIEAAAKGKPIITTDTPGCRDVVVNGLNGFLIAPNSAEELCHSMIKFIKAPHLIETMGNASRKIAIEKFDEKIVFNEMFKIYKSSGITPAINP
jgi:glycosyltransferase involved in cell wall biosynthesis